MNTGRFDDMGCEDVRDLLALYAGGECRDEERVAVEAHVSLCSSCARELDQYREARAALAGLAGGEVPPGTWKELWTGVRSEVLPGRIRRWPSIDAVLRCAAALMVGLAIGVLAHATRRPTPLNASHRAPAAAPSALAVPAAVRPLEVAPPRDEMRFHAPRARSEGSFYLPRVEAIPAGGEKDF
jgi:anti-sigma factor RsiW